MLSADSGLPLPLPRCEPRGMDVRRITEVGIAVRDLDAAVALFEQLFDAEVGELIDVPLYDMRFRMCRVGKVDFEVMEPTADTGVIADFLAKRGEGLHHIAFAVDDIGETMHELGAKGGALRRRCSGDQSHADGRLRRPPVRR